MRLLLVVAAICLASISSAQWRNIYSGGTVMNDIKSASFLNASTGYVVSQNWLGFTSDTGHTYQFRYVTINNVNFNGYPANLLFGFSIEDVHAFSTDTLLVSGDFGLEPSILYSTNGGASWLLVFHRGIPFNTVNIFNSVWQMVFPNNGSIGYACGGDAEKGGIGGVYEVCEEVAERLRPKAEC